MDKKYQYRHQQINLAEALLLIREHLNYHRNEHVEKVSLKDSLFRIAAEDIYAPMNQPPFDRSPYDGYALRGEDTQHTQKAEPVYLKVIGRVDAGEVFGKMVHQNEAVRIMTGAPIPKGADCVLPQEDTDYGEDQVRIYRSVRPGKNICRTGEDFRQGDCMIRRDTYLTAVETAILASMGYSEVNVYQRPRVGVFTTGDELLDPQEALSPGKIYNSNLYLLWGRLKEMGIEPVHMQALTDDEDRAKEVLLKYSQSLDLIITTGGVSVGKKDIIHGVLSKMQADKVFWKIRMKPGSPTVFAVYHNVPIISLSGNPFGAAANLELIVRNALFLMTGDDNLILRRKKAEIQDRFHKMSMVPRYIRGICREGKVYQSQGLQSSGVLATMRDSNCLIEIPEGNTGMNPGDIVDVLLWKE